ncbi:hypothetical protein QJS10_CPB12g00320 [Acorus calamus]|uniref:Uncharacterized protein n=1 Tax=Acorus calamus TaxID=4465 RepID=A0AAV9DR38_ACOCL|nr:hypothetical protein QJS10_CPB12g00320 [Acorus calamus]
MVVPRPLRRLPLRPPLPLRPLRLLRLHLLLRRLRLLQTPHHLPHHHLLLPPLLRLLHIGHPRRRPETPPAPPRRLSPEEPLSPPSGTRCVGRRAEGPRQAVRSRIPAARMFGNVDVLGKPDAATFMGSSVLASMLHAAAVMLRLGGRWDWFITLSAADYPLVSQDDLFHAFSSAPREINFIDHTSDIGWKDYHRVQPIVVDPGIYLARRVQIFHATERRPTPESFKFFTGSPWVILSRPLIEFCILGWDNLPRTLLLYFTNALIPEESYFHSVACNSQGFQNTTVNSDLRYMVWDNPPGWSPISSTCPTMMRWFRAVLPLQGSFTWTNQSSARSTVKSSDGVTIMLPQGPGAPVV